MNGLALISELLVMTYLAIASGMVIDLAIANGKKLGFSGRASIFQQAIWQQYTSSIGLEYCLAQPQVHL